MSTAAKQPLFTELNEEDSAIVSGAYRGSYYYHNPCASSSYSSYSYPSSSYPSTSSSSALAPITQTAYVNVFIARDDNQDIRITNGR